MHIDDPTRLRHMLEAAAEAVAMARGKTRMSLDADRVLSLALLKLIEIIGEAAAHVGQAGRDQLPELPWPAIIGMRNRLIHAYYDIDLEILWRTVQEDLPPLIAALDKAGAGAKEGEK